MISSLRDYQQELYEKTRESLANHRAVCVQSATGSGKTVIFVAMCESVYKKNKLAWIVVTRKELMKQTSDHLRKWEVPHNTIKPGKQESLAYNIHVISSDTLARRLDKIKRFPDLIIFDECHIMLDRQKTIIEKLPEHTKILGFSATPQRMDGRGLSEVYEDLIEGKSIPWLTERNFLVNLRYFAPPIEGINDLKRRGTEYDEQDLEDLLQRRKVYGKVIDHYIKHGKNRQALIFCRSVKSSKRVAEQFRARGFQFYNIDGAMNDTERYNLINKLNRGEIDGLCGCDVFIYGVDVPRVSYGAIIRPTLSKTIYYQSIGRILRPFTDPITGFIKKDALFFDHVDNISEHQEEDFPGIPPHYVEKINWNFHGTEKRKKKKNEQNIRLCSHIDFMWCQKTSCIGCAHNPDNSVSDARVDRIVVIDTDLSEKQKPVPMYMLPEGEKQEIQDEIGSAVLEYKSNPNSSPIEKLLKIAEKMGYRELWVYYKLTEESRLTANIPLLHEIARVKNYKPGWVHFARKKIENNKKIGVRS